MSVPPRHVIQQLPCEQVTLTQPTFLLVIKRFSISLSS
jgi:hypothetical protein